MNKNKPRFMIVPAGEGEYKILPMVDRIIPQGTLREIAATKPIHTMDDLLAAMQSINARVRQKFGVDADFGIE